MFLKNQIIRLSLTIAVSLFSQVNAQSGTDSIAFHSISTDLFQASATQILEDHEGFLWIGTPNGVYKFNGTTFKPFKTDNSGLTDGFVGLLYEDEEQDLYFGTLNGLNIYDRRLDIVKPYPFHEKSTFLQSRYITSIIRSGSDLWLGTLENGLYKYSIETGSTQEVKLTSKANEKDIVGIFKNGRSESLIIVTQHSVYTLDKTGKTTPIHTTEEAIAIAKLTNNTNLFLGTRSGSLVNIQFNQWLEPLSTSKKTICAGYSILAIEMDAQEKLWLGSENEGLWVEHGESGKFLNYKFDFKLKNSIRGNSIWSLYKAKNDVMWVGIFQKGLDFFDSNFFKFTHISQNYFDENSLSNDIVQCFYEDAEGNLYIGTDGGGLNYWNRDKNSFSHYSLSDKTLNTDVVLSILGRENGQLWLGSWANGLSIFDTKTGGYQVLNSANSFLASNNVFAIAEDKENRIWIGTHRGGVQVYHPGTKEHQDIKLTHSTGKGIVNSVGSILVDNNDDIWVGTETDGLFKLVEESPWNWKVQHYSKNEPGTISNDFVNCIFQDSEGHIWVGTASGLNKYFPKEDSFKQTPSSGRLPSDAVRGIVQDQSGFLWLSTDSGIVRYDIDSNEQLSYDKSDGLQEEKFNKKSAYRTSNNELLFGGINGFNIFTMDQAKKSRKQNEIIITSLKIFNKEVHADDDHNVLKTTIRQTDSITLGYHQSVFNLEFNTFTFGHRQKINYAYFLDGFETEWNYIGNANSATYTNLDPGEYTFKVKATNSDGVWGTNEKRLHITILPPFWKTWWFKLILALLLSVGVYLIYYIRVRNMKRYQMKLEKTIAIRTEELSNEKKKLSNAATELKNKNEEIQKFAYSISHDLKGPLSGIQGLMNVISIQKASNDVPKLDEYISMINTSCETMHNLIADITKIAQFGEVANKMEILDMNEILELAHNFVHAKQSIGQVDIKIGKKLPSIKGDANRMIQIFGNLLDNAIKYMGDEKHPTVLVESREKNDQIEFLVIDNGSGMDKKSLQKLFSPFERFHPKVRGTGLGLYMVKKIVESHNGTIRAESKGIGEGTTFVVSFPKIANEVRPTPKSETSLRTV